MKMHGVVTTNNGGAGIRIEGPATVEASGIESRGNGGPDLVIGDRVDFTGEDVRLGEQSAVSPPRRRLFAIPKLPWHRD